MQVNDIRGLFEDEGAVSPVIGVILMVAITVILAAVIGTFVLGLGDQVTGSTAPQADFNFDYNEGAGSTGDGEATIAHDGGDAIDAARLSVKESQTSSGSGTDFGSSFSNTVEAGDSVTGAYDSGETLRVVWTSEDGSSSQTLAKSEAP